LQQTAPGHALPRRVRPFPDETAQSYLERLALANYLNSTDLRAHLAGGRRGRHAQVDTAALAVLAGMSEQALLRAVPELCSPAHLAAFPWLAGRVGPGVAVGAAACRRCAAGRTAKPVTRWRAHEDMVCLRHRRWTGSGRFGTGAQPDLRPHPEIVAASRRHRRLARQLGGPAVEHAFRAARIICTQWHNEWEWKLPGLDERLRSLGSRYRPGSGTPADEAALYPHVVALTRLLASPAWVGPVLDEHPDDTIPVPYLDLDRIDAEIARLRAGDPGYLDWAEQQRLREEIRLKTRPGTRQFAGEIRRAVLPGFRWVPVTSHNRCEPLAQHLRELAKERDAAAPFKGYSAADLAAKLAAAAAGLQGSGQRR
jgi:hypothetical protein